MQEARFLRDMQRLSTVLQQRGFLQFYKRFYNICIYRIFWFISSKNAIVYLYVLSTFYVFQRKMMTDTLIAAFDYILIKADQHSASVCTLK